MAEDTFTEMCHALVELMVNVGLVGSVMGQYPEHVQENYTEKIRAISRFATQQIEEVQEFGEAYDSPHN